MGIAGNAGMLLSFLYAVYYLFTSDMRTNLQLRWLYCSKAESLDRPLRPAGGSIEENEEEEEEEEEARSLRSSMSETFRESYIASSMVSPNACELYKEGLQVMMLDVTQQLSFTITTYVASFQGPSKPSSLVRLLPVSQYLLELASDDLVLECGVLTSRDA